MKNEHPQNFTDTAVQRPASPPLRLRPLRRWSVAELVARAFARSMADARSMRTPGPSWTA
jgi:hypothetical protein